jgi:hypothetical protein
MMKSLMSVALLVLVTGLFGCASKPNAVSIAKDEAAAEAARSEAERKRSAKATEAAEKFLAKVPAWVAEPPRSDGVNVYAVGEGQSSRLDLARKKALLTAEFGLAKQYKQALSGSERLYQRDSASGIPQERYTLLIDKLVDSVTLVGHQQVRQEVVVVDGTYHSYVLMKLSFEEMERIISKQKAASQDKEIDAQFDELDRRLKAYRAEQQTAVPAVVPKGGTTEGAAEVSTGQKGAAERRLNTGSTRDLKATLQASNR